MSEESASHTKSTKKQQATGGAHSPPPTFGCDPVCNAERWGHHRPQTPAQCSTRPPGCADQRPPSLPPSQPWPPHGCPGDPCKPERQECCVRSNLPDNGEPNSDEATNPH